MEAVNRVMDKAVGSAGRERRPLAAARPCGRGSVVMLTADRQIDRRTLLEADSLEAAGWDVSILAVPADDQHNDDARVVRLGPQVLRAAPRESLLLRLYGPVRRHLPMGGGAMRALKAFAWKYLISQRDFHLKLFAPALAAHRADVFVAQDLPMLPVALHAARLHGAKVVYDSHELYAEQDFPEREKRIWREIEAAALPQCDLVFTINEGVARELERRYGVARVHVVHSAEHARPDGTPERRFHAALGLEADRLVLLMQGGLSAGRHLEVLVAAMAHVRDPRVHLVVLGDGRLRDALQRTVDRAGLGARVHLLPAVPQRELLAWTEAADAGIVPYQPTCLNNRLCTPNKLFEFIAAGLPVLSSDLPEIRRIVLGHGIGQVAELGDARQMAQAIDAFFGDADRLRGWREAAVRARATLNWDVEGAKLAALFEALR